PCAEDAAEESGNHTSGGSDRTYGSDDDGDGSDQTDRDSDAVGEEQTSVARTFAYIARLHMVRLQAEGMLDKVFSRLIDYMVELDCSQEFSDVMGVMLDSFAEFEKLARNTAPYLVLVGDDTCYSVPKRFAAALSDELVDMGQAVITTDGRHGEWQTGEDSNIAIPPILKGVVGWQMKILERDIFRRMACPKYQFWFDNPIYFNDMFYDLPKEYYILSQDADYADYIKRYYGTENAIQFPPAGEDAGYAGNQDRPYDVVFIGSYRNQWDVDEFTDEEREFYEYMKCHPDVNFEEGYRQYLADHTHIGESCDSDYIRNGLERVKNACRAVTSFYRDAVIETLIAAGINVHVYGDTWQNFHSEYESDLIRHPEVSVEESLEVFGHAKIGLNIMTWHKAGMTERIANVMLSGAVCLSDESSYLREHYTDGEEMVLFRLSELSALPRKVLGLLQDEDLRRRMAGKAYERARKEHTWRKRAEEFLALK
ncbi:MAG: glycosyltransferase, partial [Lachnospiraceae bacterium]|nr:glycosyltransferase [Lachnospiraceae bacterium]